MRRPDAGRGGYYRAVSITLRHPRARLATTLHTFEFASRPRCTAAVELRKNYHNVFNTALSFTRVLLLTYNTRIVSEYTY